MNKGALVKWVGPEYVGKKSTSLTKKKVYKVIAGQGDGVTRDNGTLGAFIQNEHQFVIEDDAKHCRVCTISSPNWKLVDGGESTYVPKPEYKSPIQLTTSLC